MKLFIFSGGYDSTLVLFSVFQSGTNEKVLITSVIPDYSFKKVEREKKAREKIIKKLAKLFPKIDYEVCEVTVSYNKRELVSPVRCLIQPITWLNGMICASSSHYDGTESIDVMLSYIKGDDALTHKRDLENIIQSSFNILFMDEWRPKTRVQFPLCYHAKEDVIAELIVNAKDLYYAATTCEDPYDINDNCGICHPCMELKWALVKLATVSLSKRVRDFAREELHERFSFDVTISEIETKSKELKHDDIDHVFMRQDNISENGCLNHYITKKVQDIGDETKEDEPNVVCSVGDIMI